MGFLFNNFNRKIFLKYGYESFKLKFSSQHLRKTSKLACKCIEYINANLDPTCFENIFITYRKNIDYASPNLDINNN